MQVKKQELEPDKEQRIGSKLGKEYVKAIYCHPAYLTYMQSWTRLSDFTFTHWRRKGQPTPVFLPGETQGWISLVGCRLCGCTESDMTDVT